MIHYDNVHILSDGSNSVFYREQQNLPGIFILYVVCQGSQRPRWLYNWARSMATKHRVFFSTSRNRSYYKNHSKFYANFNGSIVYEYIPKPRK